MVKRFCPVCGKLTDFLINGMCSECYIRNHKLVKIPETLKITLCKGCLSYYVNGRWKKSKKKYIEDILVTAVREIIQNRIKRLGYSISHVEVKIEFEPKMSLKEGAKMKVNTVVCGKLHEKLRETCEEHYSTAFIHFDLCPLCRVIVGGKEKAIVQIRSQGRKLSSQEIKEIQALVEREVLKSSKHDIDRAILRHEEKDGGLDYYMASLDSARYIAHVISRKYSGKTLETQKVIGVDRRERREGLVRFLFLWLYLEDCLCECCLGGLFGCFEV